MNKHGIRWMSLILSVAIMIGSLTYIATGINAETTAPTNSYVQSATSYASKGILLDVDDIISTDEDRMLENGTNTWVYETVLREDGYLVNENGMAEDTDIYLDLAASGKTSVEVGDNVGVTVTMENTTANDSHKDSTSGNNVSDAVHVEAISFGVSYDGTYLKFLSGSSNIEGVEFKTTGTGAGASVQISYTSGEDKPTLKAYEMPVFELNFETVKENASGDSVASVKIEPKGAAVTPAALKVDAGEAENFRIYKVNGNSALEDLVAVIQKTADSEEAAVHLNPEFDPEIKDYFITVPHDTSKSDIKIKATKSSKDATVECIWANGNNTELAAGMNRCTVKVTAKDGSVQEYNLIVKKLALDTLADPKTTLKKTVTLANEGNSEQKDSYKVNYEIKGANNIVAEGNDYVFYISSPLSNTFDPEAIRAITANLEDSTLTVIDTSLASPKKFTYDLSSPSLEMKEESTTLALSPEQFLLDNFDNDNKYLIMASSSVTETTVTERDGYTEIIIPDDANMSRNIMNAGIDNTAAEFVFIVDFSNAKNGEVSQNINYGLVKSIFGYDDGNAATQDIPGYVQQLRNMLTNDSTAKVTIIAVGADIGTGSTEDEWAKYGVKFVNVPSDSDVPTYTYDYANSVYCGKTYTIPQDDNDLWGFTGENSEQHNIWEYCKSFDPRTIEGSSTAYTQAAVADSELLAEQYAAAMLQAKALLADANNAQLVVLTPNDTLAKQAYNDKIGSAAGVETTIIPVGSYSTLTADNVVAKSVYEELVLHEKEGFNCNPADNARNFDLVDELNGLIFQLIDDKENASFVGSDANAIQIDTTGTTATLFDISYPLPALGEYELFAEYTAERYSVNRIDTETHYYPISNTVKTEVGEDGTVIQDDIPTVAPSYDDEYQLEVTKALKAFDDINSAKPESSKATYVLHYTNTGKMPLTNVGITDTKIMLAGTNYKVYILAPGKTAPASGDAPATNVVFTGANDAAAPYMGEATVARLEPGQSIYVEYTITIPEASKVTVGTTGVAGTDATKVITSYVLENIATGASVEVEPAQVNLKVDFLYDKDSGGTVSSATSSTTPPSSLGTVTGYQPSSQTSGFTYTDNVPTGESSVGYIVAISLLFGAIGMFGVTVYGMVIDKKIAQAANGRKFYLR